MAYKIEKHKVKKGTKEYEELYQVSQLTRALYNQANFITKQNFLFNYAVDKEGNILLNKEGKPMPKRIGAFTMGSIARNPKNKIINSLYNQLHSKIAESVFAVVDQNWKSYVASIKDWSKNPSKYKGKPKPPKYLKQDEVFQVVQRNPSQNNGFVSYGKKVGAVKFKETGRFENAVCKQIRAIPNNNYFTIELVYDVNEKEIVNKNKKKYAGIDLGLDNLLTVVTNTNDVPFIISGKPLLSRNKYYNTRLDSYKSILEKTQSSKKSREIDKLWTKRKNYMSTYIHKATTDVVNYLEDNNVTDVVLGYNKEMKQHSRLKNFVQIPILSVIQLLEYKLADRGITLTTVEESYTSGTSFLDNEEPTKENYDSSRRTKRGLFIANDKTELNADVNAAYQIMKKSKFDIDFDVENLDNLWTPIKVAYT